MAKYLSNIDLVGNQLQNAVIHAAGIAPDGLAEGQIYYNTSSDSLFLYNGTSWINMSGDISEVVAGSGLTGGGASGSVTLNIGSGDGITVNADSIEVNAEASQFSFVSGVLTISSGAIGPDELAATAVTAGSYGSSTAIPVITVDADGRLTAASTASIATTLNVAADSGSGDGVALATDTLTIAGTTAQIDTSISGDIVTISLPTSMTTPGDLTVTGNLTVSGTTTTVNTETINLADNIITLNSNETGTPTQSAGIEVERGTSDNVSLVWSETLAKWTFTNDGTTFYSIPTPSDLTSAVTDREYVTTVSTSPATVTHNLGSKDVIVQLYDTATDETVYADVVRALNSVTVTWEPSANLRVLITKIG